MKRKDKFLPTTDDWYPNYEKDTVKCSVFCIRGAVLKRGNRSLRARTKPIYKVCIWGKDDTGMEREFSSLSGAENMYNNLPNPITKSWLLENKFISA